MEIEIWIDTVLRMCFMFAGKSKGITSDAYLGTWIEINKPLGSIPFKVIYSEACFMVHGS